MLNPTGKSRIPPTLFVTWALLIVLVVGMKSYDFGFYTFGTVLFVLSAVPLAIGSISAIVVTILGRGDPFHS